jgi:hypothetical protein
VIDKKPANSEEAMLRIAALLAEVCRRGGEPEIEATIATIARGLNESCHPVLSFHS